MLMKTTKAQPFIKARSFCGGSDIAFVFIVEKGFHDLNMSDLCQPLKQGYYNKFSDEYIENELGTWRTHMERYSLYKAMGDAAGLKILDLGSGDGTNTRFLIDMGAQSIIGVDISEEQCNQANGKSEGYDTGRLSFKVGHYLNVGEMKRILSEQEHCFDIIVCSWVFCIALNEEELACCAETITCFLKHGGIYVGADNYPEAKWLSPEYYAESGHLKSFTLGKEGMEH